MFPRTKCFFMLGAALVIGVCIFASGLGSLSIHSVWGSVSTAGPASVANPGPQAAPSTPLSAGHDFSSIWQRANQATSYSFNAVIEQTLLPRARADMIGQQEQRVNLYLNGEVQRNTGLSDHGDRARINLRADGLAGDSRAVTLVEENGRSFIQQGDKLVPTDSGVAGVSPVAPSNFLDYLAAAKNIHWVEPTASEDARAHYTFDIDNTLLFQQALDRALQAGQPRPIMPPAMQSMFAHGEVWTDAYGLPRRQIIYLNVPGVNQHYDADVRLTLDLTQFGGVPPIPALVAIGAGEYRFDSAHTRANSEDAVESLKGFTLPIDLLQHLLVLLIVIGIMILIAACYRRHRRATYAGIAVGMSMLLVVTTPLSVAQAEAQRTQTAKALSVAQALGFAAAPETPPAQTSADELLREGLRSLAPNGPRQSNWINLAQTDPLPKCGEGTPGVDTDQDGLTDQQEVCLGTNPRIVDSDHDGVTDAIEAYGFTCGNKTWNTDPLNPDSNGDGIADGRQYPSDLVDGGVAKCDTDGDGIPDVWDTDNDNDGMPNKFDLSPNATAATYSNTLKLQIDPQGYTGTVYVEMQVQPQNPKHLFYSATALDWPNDDSAGQITDLDKSKDDIRLLPMLEIETNIVNRDLAIKYGYSIVTSTNPTKTLIYTPLRPQSDGGGLNKAFYVKIPYAAPELTQPIIWSARMVWMVQAKVDQYIDNCYADNSGVVASGRCTQSTNDLVHIYRDEPFRLSGLNIVKSERFETAVFGTPQTPTEDRNLFQVLEGLTGSLLDYQRFISQTTGNSAIQEFAKRFTTSGTPLDLRFQLPENVTVAVSTTLAAHQDAGIAASGELLNSYLNRYFASPTANLLCTETRAGKASFFPCATLGFLTEQTVGSLDLNAIAQNSDGTYAVALSNISVITQRNLKAAMYERLGSGEWQAADPSRTLAIINTRYGAVLGARAEQYSELDPNINTNNLLVALFMQYLMWDEGYSRVVSFDQTALMSPEPDSEQAQATISSLNTSRKIKDVVDQVKSIGAVLGAATSPTTPEGVLGKAVKAIGARFEDSASFGAITIKVPSLDANHKLTFTSKTISSARTIKKFGAKALIGASSVVLAASIAAAIAQSVCDSEGNTSCTERLTVANKAIGSFEAIVGSVSLIAAFGGLQKTDFSKAGLKNGLLDSVGDGFGKAGAAFAVIGTGLAIGTAWAEFGLLAKSGAIQPGSAAYKLALAKAIGSTIWAILILVLSFIPFGIGDLLSAIFGLIDTIIGLATGGDLDLTTVIVTFFYNVKLLTTLIDQAFTDTGTGWRDRALGMVAGNIFVASNRFTATIGATGNGKASDVTALNTYAEGRFVASASNTQDSTAVEFNAIKGTRDCPVKDGIMNCKNTLNAEFKLLKPGINTQLQFASFFDFSYLYKECIFACGVETKRSSESTTQPSSASDIENATQKITIDVLPPTLDELWTWSALVNPDSDGDGLSNADEVRLGSTLTNPDSDGDGLSDGFEVTTSHTNLNKADTDNDGLNDGLESQFGLAANQPDTDGDGLLDGEEVFHDIGIGIWQGGWLVTLPGGLQTRVYSDPLSADGDDDGLSDRSERANAASPNGYNTSPRLFLSAAPLTVQPDGAFSVYVAPGQRVTYTLFLATGPTPIKDTLAVCLPSVLSSIALGPAFGNRTLTPQLGSCNGSNTQYSFSFALSNTLQIGEFVSTTITAIAGLGATTSQRSVAQTSISTGGKVLSDSVPFVLDADKPGQPGFPLAAQAGMANASIDAAAQPAPDQVDATPLPGILFSAPTDGAILQRAPGGSTYIVGGYSSDATSWIDHVDVDTGSGAGNLTATGTSPWSYAWQLPPDGNYTLSARAIDAVNNISALTTTQVLVDGTPPTATLVVPGNGYVRPAANSTIVLNGTASDNLAGLSLIQISINNRAWTTLLAVPDNQARLSANWSYTWTLPQSADASGTYVMRVRAVDRAGNTSLPTESRLVVDGLPPTDNLTTNKYFNIPDVRANQLLSLHGRADDLGNVPLPSRPTALAASVNTILSATTWLQYGSISDDNAGVKIAWLGDVNGDGRADLGVGLPASTSGAGRVAIIYGRGGNWPVPPNAEALTDSPTSFVGAAGAGLGSLIVPAGDVNGDNFSDYLIGDSVTSRGFLVFGRGTPLGASLPLTGAAPTAQWNMLDVSGIGPLTGMASAGDVNGDSFDDLLISAGGKLYVLLGHSSAWYASTDVASEAAAILTLPANATATGVGDVNKNGFADFVVTGPNAVYLLAGNAAFAPRGRQALQVPADAIGTLPSVDSSVAVTSLGDVNGDNMSDFIYSSGSAPRAVLGRQSGTWAYNIEFSGYTPAPSGFLAAPGDVNADGFNDMILGVPSNNSAYLVLGAASLPASPVIQATFTGVAAVASAPYSAGADLNCDLSADLLMLSTQTIASPSTPSVKGSSLFGSDSFVSQQNLPVAPTVNNPADNPAGVFYVDDDFCSSCANDGHTFFTNAASSIADALILAAPNTKIVVKPGVYQPFTVTTQGISIIGSDPDSVIIDGRGEQNAVSVINVENVRLSNLTVRNAVRLLRLTGAGQNQGPGNTFSTVLDRVVMHSFTGNAIYMDNASTVDVQRSTIVGDASSGPHIFVDRSAPDPYFPIPTWTTQGSLPANVGTGSLLASTHNGAAELNIYAINNTTPITFQRYNTNTNVWAARALPAGVTTVKGMVGDSPFLKAVMGNGASNSLAYMYLAATDTWSACAANAPFTPGTGFAMSRGNTNQSAYVLAGGGATFYLLNCLAGWTALAPIPLAPGVGAALVTQRVSGKVYALVGGNRANFYSYNLTNNTWSAMPNAPFNANDGAGMAYSDGIWAIAGGNSSSMGYFDDGQSKWVSLPFAAPPGAIGAGGSIVAYGNALTGLPLYVLRGGGTNSFYSYGPAGFAGYVNYYPGTKLRLTNTALVGASSPAALNWLNSAAPQFDFDYGLDSASQFVNGGGAISPTILATQTVSFAAAKFSDVANRLYRTEQGSTLNAGYYTLHSDAYVSALYCPTCANDGRTWGVDAFSSVQAAIDSGAPRVRILPGVYQERITLVNGVQVIGSGAESTILQSPTGVNAVCLPIYVCTPGINLNTIPFITADGIKSATLSRVSVVGLGSSAAASGVRASNGATLKLSRNIFRDTGNAVLLDGSGTDVEIVNNTFAKNGNGIVAINKAGLDVRNNSFSNSTFGIIYDPTAAQLLRQYNNYYAINFPLLTFPGSQSVTPNGLGEITLDPFFADVSANDFRLLGNSPLIDAGNPSDSTPPNAGRVDIGYSESGQAAFYASNAYCAQCANDGLIWQVDAFNTIQSALDAAANYLRGIGCVKPSDDANPFAPASNDGLCESRVVVGVAGGTYNEHISVPSYVQLAGVGADVTTLNGQGITVPVTFNGVVQAQISGLKITGAGNGATDAAVRVLGASNTISITRNVIVSSPGSAIRFEGGASGNVAFNTIQATVDGVNVSDANTWATVSNNIISGAAATALRTTGGGLLQSNYNLLFAATHYVGVSAGLGDITGQSPLFVSGSDFTLQATSPAIDAADPNLLASVIPVGGGDRADLGYKELVATPLALLFGKLGSTPCYVGNSGVQQVEVGLASVNNPNLPITATLPSAWAPVNLDTPASTASFWSGQVLPVNGLYRLYTRATDVLGNQESPVFNFANSSLNLYSGGFVADGLAPTVTLVSPLTGFSAITAAFVLTGTAEDYVGTRFSVAMPYFEATTSGNIIRIAGDWVNTGWDGSSPRTFRGVASLVPGAYAIVAKASDQAGNTGSSITATIALNAASGSNHVVAFVSPPNTGWTNQSSSRVTGAALFGTLNGTGVVTMVVNGGTVFTATLADPLASISTGSVDVPLNVGSNSIVARASNGSGVGPVSSWMVQRDIVAPVLVAPPIAYFSRTTTLNGTATDASSGVDAVEVSVDGGYRWMPATLIGNNWSLTWTAAPGNQNTNYPARVRARDRAGNIQTTALTLIVDDLAPSDFGIVQFNIPSGTRLSSPQSLVISWTAPIDNGSVVTTFAKIDQISQTVASALAVSTTLNTPMNLDGAWYAHLAARDGAGNYNIQNFGPWYVNSGLFCQNPQQPILLDGNLDLDHNEWLSGAFLDDDERPSVVGSPVSRDRQSLYTIWDANAVYVGWRGGWWDVDGTLFVYLSTGGAGSTQLISPTVSNNVLPFAADVAVVITGKAQGTLYRFISGAWQAQGGLSFTQSDSGDTEMRIPLSVAALTDVRMMAFAMADGGQPWSVFPTTNPLNEAWTAAFHWQPICSVTAPNAGQPRGVSVLTQLSSLQNSGILLSPSSVLTYMIALNNRERRSVANTVLTVTASSGLAYQSAGASTAFTCQSCTLGASQWRIAVPTLAANTITLVTVTAQLGADLSAVPQVSTTLIASAEISDLSGALLTHMTDGVPPTVTVLLDVPRAVSSGTAIIEGLASDNSGSGVAWVEVRPAGSGTWQLAIGNSTWFTEINTPSSGEFTLDVRATDRFGQTSAPQTFTFVVDTVSPTLSLNLSSIISGSLATVGGNVSDPLPAGQEIRNVEVQIESGNTITPGEWLAAAVAALPATNANLSQPSAVTQAWTFGWLLPEADGAQYRVRARATDEAGNVSYTDWQTTTIDSVSPVVTVTAVSGLVTGTVHTAPLSGVVTDGSGVQAMRMVIYAPDGSATTELITLVGNRWSWIPQRTLTDGGYQLRVEAIDVAGNLTQVGPYVLGATKITRDLYLPIVGRGT